MEALSVNRQNAPKYRVEVLKAKSGHVWTVGAGQFGCLGHGRCGSGMTIFTPLPLGIENAKPDSHHGEFGIEDKLKDQVTLLYTFLSPPLKSGSRLNVEIGGSQLCCVRKVAPSFQTRE